jgi:hypothetical protein
MVTAAVVAETPAAALSAVEQLSRAAMALALDGQHVSFTSTPVAEEDTPSAEEGS